MVPLDPGRRQRVTLHGQQVEPAAGRARRRSGGRGSRSHESQGALWEQHGTPRPRPSSPCVSGHAVRGRTVHVAIGLALAVSWLGWRAFDVSVLKHERYLERGNRQQLRTFRQEASRGDILDRNYVSMAVNNQSFRVIMNPRVIRAHERTEEVFAHLLHIFPDLDPAYLRRELGRDKAYRMLKLRVAPEEARQLRALGLPGIGSISGERPPRLLGAHILGRVDGQGKGNLGVELSLDEDLRGRDATSPAFYAAHRGRGQQLLVEGHPDPALSRGDDVVLTIDTAIQDMAEREINTLVENWHPVGASVVVLDPESGAILALANRPTFDPNHKIGSASQTSNLAVQAAYEPGSTVKAITVAAALEQGVIRKDETFFCENGYWKYTPQHAIRDTKRSEYLTVTEILATSSNICTTKIYERLGKESLHRWVKSSTSARAPAYSCQATRGLLADWEKWSDIQAANISFGQGMSASPSRSPPPSPPSPTAASTSPPSSRRSSEPPERPPGDTPRRGAHRQREHGADHDGDAHRRGAHQKGTGKKASTATASPARPPARGHPAGGYFEHQYYASFVGALQPMIRGGRPRLRRNKRGHYGNQVAPTFQRLGASIMNASRWPGGGGRRVPDVNFGAAIGDSARLPDSTWNPRSPVSDRPRSPRVCQTSPASMVSPRGSRASPRGARGDRHGLQSARASPATSRGTVVHVHFEPSD